LELKLENGSYVPGGARGLEQVDGAEELLQRIEMKLRTKRGSFYPLPEYGSRLYTLHSIKPSLRENAAKQFILEALADEPQLALESLDLGTKGDGEMRLDAVFSYDGERLSVSTGV
jgi:phage baseplate assembly protein W